MSIEKRKEEHIAVAMDEGKSQYKGSALFEYVLLPYRALPELDMEEVSLKAIFLGKEFSYPIMVAGMTGGFQGAKKINEALALFAEEKGIPFGLGSQRAMIEKPELKGTYDVKRVAPHVFLVGNIGGAQLLEYSIEQIEEMAQAVELDALAIHINPLQEVIQPEGDRKWKGVLEKIAEVRERLSIPVYVKEVGAGIDPETVDMLKEAGIEWVDIQGKGGTSWSKIEYARGKAVKGFEEWGIPTALAILLSRDKVKIVGSGGIRSGVDVAKAIALGASFTAAALPFLKALKANKLEEMFEEWMEQLRIAMFLTGSKSVEELQGKAIPYGLLRELWTAYR